MRGRFSSASLFIIFMGRYYYERPKQYQVKYGIRYTCDHPAYRVCTLYLIRGYGLAVIQQRYIVRTKATYWTEIDPWLVDELYLHKKFTTYFNKHASKPVDGVYPTVTIRQIMWALRMKPMKKQPWETTFDKSPI